MFSKFRIFFVLITMIFSMNLAHADSKDTKKNKNHFLKFQNISKKKKLKDKNGSSRFHRQGPPPERKFKTAGSKKVFYKSVPAEKPLEIYNPSLDCDSIFMDLEIENKILKSDYGYKMLGHVENIFNNIKNMYLDTINDLDCEVDLSLDYFFDYSLIGLETDTDLASAFEDFEKLFLMQNYIFRNDLKSAENIAVNVKSIWAKNMALENLFDEYLLKNDILDAKRVYSMMEFDLEDEDEVDDFSDITDRLIIAYLRNNDFQKAEKLAMENVDVGYKDYDLKLIVKYYTRKGDIDNAKRIIEKISKDYNKREAQVYVVDYFAREKKIGDFQKFVFSINDEEFKKAANFVMNIYQNDFDEAEKNIPYDYEGPLENIAEILISLNRIPEAEYLINYFGDEDDIEMYQMFFIYSYLKNGQIDEAKRIRDTIEDPIDKVMASKLILAFVRG